MPNRRLEGSTVSTGALCLMFAATLWPLRICAQAPTAEILGTVTDPSGAPVREARVTVVNLGTQEVRPFMTDISGNYDVPLLLPGRYTVKVERPGFKLSTTPDIALAQRPRRVRQNQRENAANERAANL